LPVAPRPREGPLTEPIAAVQPWLRELVFLPLERSCRWFSGYGKAVIRIVMRRRISVRRSDESVQNDPQHAARLLWTKIAMA
jgi:hypothetical protein